MRVICLFFFLPNQTPGLGGTHHTPGQGKNDQQFWGRSVLSSCPGPIIAAPHGTTSPLPFPSLSTPLSFSLFNLFPLSPPNPFHIHTSLSHPSSHLLPLYSFFGVRVCVIFLKPFFKYNRNPSIVFSSSIILSLILSFIIIIYHSLSPLPNH